MKRLIKSFGFILLYMAIYFYFQFSLSSIFLFFNIFITKPDFFIRPDKLAIISATEAYEMQTWAVMIIAAVLSFVVYWGVERLRRQRIESAPLKKSQIVASVLLALGMELSVVLILMLPFLKDYLAEFQNMMNYIDVGPSLWVLISVGIIGPLIEEFLFRGLIFRELKACMPPMIAILIQALLFGAFHMNMVQFIYASCIGFFLGYAAHKTHSLYASMLIHVVYNLFNLFHSSISEYLPWQVMLILIPLGIVFILSGLLMLQKNCQNNA